VNVSGASPPPPVNVSLPSVTGVATSGQSLKASGGSWSNNPSGYAYQWEDCDTAGLHCSLIPNATAQTYTLTSADVGHRLRVKETATNAGGAGSPATSAATAIVTSISPTAHLAKVLVSSKHGSATFHLTATGDATGFQCALVRQRSGKHRHTPSPKYSHCGATKTFSHLGVGQYVFYVRAVGPAGASKTPAIHRFKIT